MLRCDVLLTFTDDRECYADKFDLQFRQFVCEVFDVDINLVVGDGCNLGPKALCGFFNFETKLTG